jgi:prepilin-type N-terminal cleavage/methylation domain-containing protein
MQYFATSLEKKKGFTLIEVIVSVGVFVLVSFIAYQGYAQILQTAQILKSRMIGTNLANEYIEIIRNAPYESVGTIGGIPAGVFSPLQNVEREGRAFQVATTIRNIDHAFDGVAGGVPDDSYPADAKLVEIEVQCPVCKDFKSIIFHTWVAPENIEGVQDGGVLRVNVFDAFGEPVSLADISIVNSSVSPAVNLNDVSGLQGILNIVGAEPSVEGYEIVVTKDGYSTDRTLSATVANPHPIKPHTTVAQGSVTSVSFFIDKVSTINLQTVNDACVPVPGVDLSLASDKIIGTEPTVLKYDTTFATNASGEYVLDDLEWGIYTLGISAAEPWNIFGINPGIVTAIDPDSVYPYTVTVDSATPNVFVEVFDQATGESIENVEVRLQDGGTVYLRESETGYRAQSSWQGGSGQELFEESDAYASDDSNVTTLPSGALALSSSEGVYQSLGTLISSTFDVGTNGVVNAFTWESDTPAGTEIRFQIAVSDVGTPSNFVGPDGTSLTYFTDSGSSLASVYTGERFVRYKVELVTADPGETPILERVDLSFSSPCLFPGQVGFSDVASGTYTITITAPGFTSEVDTLVVGSDWTHHEVLLESL